MRHGKLVLDYLPGSEHACRELMEMVLFVHDIPTISSFSTISLSYGTILSEPRPTSASSTL